MNKPTQDSSPTPTPNPGPKFNEEQMDQLLTAFYKTEVPEQLSSLPSSWPQVNQQPAAQKSQTAELTVPAATEKPVGPNGSSTGRGIVVAVATLAACLLVMAISNFDNNQTTEPAGVANSVEPLDRDAEAALINVSADGTGTPSAPIDDTGLSLEELEGVELKPAAGSKSVNGSVPGSVPQRIDGDE